MKTLPFIKMHGLGNDYVYIDAFNPDTAAILAATDLSDLARRMSDRHFGVGSDGLVLIMPSHCADIRMRMFNADGSEAEMCGNASRCIAKYAYEQGLCGKTMTLETLAGIKHLTITTNAQNRVTEVTVAMGQTMGNPHKVFIVEEPVDTITIHEIKGTNAEWVNVLNRNEIAMRVWERGTGETMACGTGACASAAAAMDKGLTDSHVTVHLRGGDLDVQRDKKGILYLTGTATEVFKGTYNWED
ncbi:MAG: diaminopimelate epimerase [Paludibacteraceae bacterium]|nr:diaminopimelate epimerase [Paludibacteraceae bacterium]